MTNLEITKLCAEAMGIPHTVCADRYKVNFVEILDHRNPGNGGEYDPINNDAQAMKIIKEFPYIAIKAMQAELEKTPIENCDFNMAICEYIAKMKQETK